MTSRELFYPYFTPNTLFVFLWEQSATDIFHWLEKIFDVLALRKMRRERERENEALAPFFARPAHRKSSTFVVLKGLKPLRNTHYRGKLDWFDIMYSVISVQFSSVYSHFYKIFTLYVVR